MSPKIKITTLCENRAPRRGLLGEHGLAMLLEVGNQKILFDTGAGSSLMLNSQVLGLDLGSLTAVVLSHGHYDHTGGLKILLEKNNPLPIYAHPDLFIDKYSITEGTPPRFIGLSWTQAHLERLGGKFYLERGPVSIGDGIIMTGQIPRFVEDEKPEPHFFLKTAQGYAQDFLADDQALIVESPAGSIVLLGCAHAGLINTLQYVTDLTKKGRIFAVIGGMHLQGISDSRLRQTLASLQTFAPQFIAPCHCTGFKATVALYNAFSKQFLLNQVGSVFQFDY